MVWQEGEKDLESFIRKIFPCMVFIFRGYPLVLVRARYGTARHGTARVIRGVGGRGRGVTYVTALTFCCSRCLRFMM